MAITRHGEYGGPRQRYGSFAGKSPAGGGGHPVDEITRLGLYGGPRPLYGSFDGKVESGGGTHAPGRPAHPVDRLTRLGLYGGPRGLYGSFDGKVEATPVAPDRKTHPVQYGPGWQDDEEQEIIALMLSFLHTRH